MAKIKERPVSDYRNFDIENLVKWLNRNFKKQGFNFKVEKSDNSQIITCDKLINPYKVTNLPHGWTYNRSEGFKNSNKHIPETFSVKQPSKEQVKSMPITDTSDLMFVMEILNPDCSFYIAEDGRTLEISGGKAIKDCVLPTSYKFDGQALSNEGNVNNGSNALALAVKSVQAHTKGAQSHTNLTESLSDDKFKSGKGKLESYEQFAHRTTDAESEQIESRIKNNDLFDIKNYELDELKSLFKQYVPYFDPITKKIFIQDRKSGVILQDESKGNACKLIHDIITQSTNKFNPSEVSTETIKSEAEYGEVNWEEVEQRFENIKGSNSGAKDVILTTVNENNAQGTGGQSTRGPKEPNKDNNGLNAFMQLYKTYIPVVLPSGQKVIQTTDGNQITDNNTLINQVFFIHSLASKVLEVEGNLNQKSVERLYNEATANPEQIQKYVNDYQNSLHNPEVEEEQVMVMKRKNDN